MILRASGPASASWRAKQILASLIVIGSLGSLTVAGTFALLRSEESNARSSLATGTLTFDNTVGSGTTCYSYAGPASPGNANNECEPLMTSSTLNYPGTPALAKVRIVDDGSLDVGDLSLYMGSCVAQNTPSAPSPGGGDPCAAAGAQLSIQETNSSGTPTKCWFPNTSGVCEWVKSSLHVFAGNDNSVGSALDLGSGPAHGQTRYFSIELRLPPEASNSLQGMEAVFGLTWHATT